MIAKGKIVSSKGLNLESPIHVKSSPCQDKAMLKKLQEDETKPPVYNLISQSCITWSTEALQYGLEEDGMGKCCNPDKTLYKDEEEKK